eukprot:GFYU01024456.1.p2 GENE.GFYU01024456.1~~GFYU01024456.1.p2  ORF type:complete len:103 (-),score=10.99 GFYU01024456.1:531-839(-)
MEGEENRLLIVVESHLVVEVVQLPSPTQLVMKKVFTLVVDSNSTPFKSLLPFLTTTMLMKMPQHLLFKYVVVELRWVFPILPIHVCQRKVVVGNNITIVTAA